MNGAVSESLWIYFVLMIPLTIIVVGSWWFLDRRTVHANEVDEDEDVAEEHMNKLEAQIMARIRKRTGARLTWNINAP